MATIKLHAYLNEDDGTESCDYRGQGELTGTHRTLLEREFGPDVQTNGEIEAVIEEGPQLNRLFRRLLKGAIPVGTESASIRIGVFDH